jgi:hypothetical protein
VSQTEENLLSTVATAIQSFLDEASEIVEAAIKEFEKAVSGSFGSLDEMSEFIDRQMEASDRYLENYEEVYKLSKLNRNLQKEIDSMNSAKGRRELLALQDELNKYAKDGVQMSQYEMEHLEKKIELKKAEIAMEDA